jgi:ERF superfamily
MNVYQKLNAARKQFHTQKLKKSGHNKFVNYYYFELGDFIIPALEIFDDLGLTSVITFGTEVAVMNIYNNEKPEEWITLNSPMSTADLKGCHEVQNLGAVQTYLRRYLWVAALEIVEHDALDATTGKKGDGPVITPKGDIGNDIPADEKEFLIEMAASCENLVSQGKAAAAKSMVDEAALEADQKVWLWGQLTSTARSAIKKAQ